MIRGGGFSVLSNQFEQAVDGLCLRDILLDTFLGPIEGNLATTGTDIAVIGICHLAGAIDDTAHDAYLQTY